MKTKFYLLLVAIVTIIATGLSSCTQYGPKAETNSSEDEIVYEDTKKECEYVLTVQDVLDFRETLKESARIDSMFLAMPDPILIDILITHGTSLSNKDIVYIYEGNKKHYDDIHKGANIQRDIITPMDSVKNSRDSLSNQRAFFATV